MKLENLEHATLSRSRIVPKWVIEAIELERAEIRKIECPRQRRIREIELDMKRDAIELHLMGSL